jgi:hypothetical protein
MLKNQSDALIKRQATTASQRLDSPLRRGSINNSPSQTTSIISSQGKKYNFGKKNKQ